MECPYCKEEMVPGEIRGRAKLTEPPYFYEDDKSPMSMENRKLPGEFSWGGYTTRAHYCTKCKVYIIQA